MSDLADQLAAQRHALVSAVVERNPGLATLITQHHYATLERLMVEDHASGSYHLSPHTSAFLAQVPAGSRAGYKPGMAPRGIGSDGRRPERALFALTRRATRRSQRILGYHGLWTSPGQP